MKALRVLALSPIPEEGAGARFRVYQYIPSLEANGFQVTVSPFFTPRFFRVVYEPGAYVRKTSLFALRTLARLRLLLRRRDFDLFFVYREAMPIGPPVIEMALSRAKAQPLVYDFDDAIFLPNHSDANKAVGMMKYPQKVPRIIQMSSYVVAGNAYLAEYARSYKDAVVVIPTCVDTTKFTPWARRNEEKDRIPIVGWIGSHSTVKYLRTIAPVLEAVARKHRFRLRVVGSHRRDPFPGVDVDYRPWSLEREIADFATCDVGLYPLWDDPWTRGKCGFKAIQFMACGVPVVAAAVGVNREIVQDGVNGFLATTEAEWAEKLAWLLEDPRLREKLGQEGRRTVRERYSTDVHVPTLVATLRKVMDCR